MGYRITIDQAGCLNCGVCMDVCPVQALDMTRPPAGIETGAGWDGPCLDDGIPGPGRRVRRVPDLRPRVPGQVITLAMHPRATPLAPRQGPLHRPRGCGRVVRSPRSRGKRSSRTTGAVRRSVPVAAPNERRRRQTLAPIVARPTPEAPCQAACPAGTDAGRYVGLIAGAATTRPTPWRRRSTRSRRSVAGSARRPARRPAVVATLDEPISIRTLKRFAVEHGTLPPIPAPADEAGGARGDRRRRPGGDVGRLLPGATRLSGHGLRGHAGARRHDGDRDPRVPAAARGAARRDRAHPRARRGPPAGLGDGPRLHAGDLERGLPGDLPRDGRFPAAASASPGTDARGRARDPVPEAGQPRRGAAARRPVVVVGGGSTAMDAARSALRSGAERDGALPPRRADMPAQPEEVEAAEREGIRSGRRSTVGEVVGRDGAVPGSGAPTGRSPHREPRASRPDGPRRHRRGARSVHPARGRGIGVSAWPASSPTRDAGNRPAGVFAGGDVVSGAKTIIDAVAAGRRAAGSIHEYLAGVADGEAAIMADRPLSRRPPTRR